MIQRKIMDFVLRNIIPETLVLEAVAQEFGIQPEQMSTIYNNTSTHEIITYSLSYSKTGFATNLSLFIDVSQVTINKNVLEIAKSLAMLWVQDILIPVPTELPGLENANQYLLLIKSTGEMFLVIETDSEDGIAIDESPAMMKKYRYKN